MKKILKITIPAIVILLVVISAIFYISYRKTDNTEAVEAFKTIEAEDIYKELYIFSSISKNDINKIDYIWNDILNIYNLNSDNPSIVSYDKDGSQKEERQSNDGKVFVNLTNTDRKDYNSIYVNINSSDSSCELEDSMSDMEKIFNSQKLKYEVTLSIKGYKVGKLNKDQIYSIKNILLTKCHAKEVTDYEEDGVYFFNGYSRSMGRYVRIAGKKVNLDIAFRYSETDDKTYIYLATPIIRTEI